MFLTLLPFLGKLRHTFASILFACGVDPPTIMQQLGHTDAAFTLRVYAHSMRRDAAERERLRALVEGRDWAPLALRSAATLSSPTHRNQRLTTKGPLVRTFRDGRGWFRTSDLSRVKRALSH